MRSKFLATGPEAMARPKTVESRAIEPAVPAAKMSSATTASEGLGMVESSSSVSPPEPPTPCTSPTPYAESGVRSAVSWECSCTESSACEWRCRCVSPLPWVWEWAWKTPRRHLTSSRTASTTMMIPMATSADFWISSGRYWPSSTSGSPRRISVVPWPRPQLRPMKVAFLTASGSSAAMRVVTAARWSGSLACLSPKSRLTSRTTPIPAEPCRNPSSQGSMAATRYSSSRGPPLPPLATIGTAACLCQLRGSPVSPQPGAPHVHAPARAGAREYAFDAGVDRVQVAEELLQVEVEVLQEVHLVHQHQIGRAEHQGVLERLLFTLGDRVDHHPRVLPDPELRRTHQVPDVLYDEDVHLVQRKLGEPRAHHVRVEVALAAEAGVRVHLHQRDVEARQPVGVERRLHVALEDA